MVRTRFAPSPTGDLHLGGAWTALASYWVARRNAGRILLRVEDLDPPRVVAGSAARVAEDLLALGLDWDEGPVAQSSRSADYEASLAELARLGLVYRCDCSRQEIASVASAPHDGEDLVYPGTCRDRSPSRTMRRPPSLRFRVPDDETRIVSFVDAIRGAVESDVRRDAGDFVLKRGDGAFAYQLAVALDDVAMGVTDVVRGQDLLASTARQILLQRCLGFREEPRYWHVPLVVGADGARLAKRDRAVFVRGLLETGVSPQRIVGTLAHGLGLLEAVRECTPAELARDIASPRWRLDPWRAPTF